MKPTVIWDFNGTILDDVGIGIDSINTLLARRSLPLIADRAAYHALFRFPIIDYYADLGLDVGDYDALAHEWVEQYMSRLSMAPLREGILQALDALRAAGYRQIILSATEQNQLNGQVDGLGIADYFEELLGTGDIYAASKIDRALVWRREHREELILIGDTDHDADTAKVLGARCVLLSGGHQSRERLEQLGCRVIEHPMQLLALLTREEIPV